MRALFSFFWQEPQEMISVSIAATGRVNFKQIDSSIKHDASSWGQRYPMFTDIEIPKNRADEITAKLKRHKEITSVNGELTEHGVLTHDRLSAMVTSARQQFVQAEPPFSVSISATTQVNFKQIYSRLVRMFPWSDDFTTRVQLPRDNADEIIAKLKAHREITAVNGEQTVHDSETHDETRAHSLHA